MDVAGKVDQNYFFFLKNFFIEAKINYEKKISIDMVINTEQHIDLPFSEDEVSDVVDL